MKKEIHPFKLMTNNPLESVEIQKFLFNNGFTWIDGSSKIEPIKLIAYFTFNGHYLNLTNPHSYDALDLPNICFEIFKDRYMTENQKPNSRPIDNVTVDNLGVALRLCNIQLSNRILDRVIDLVGLIEEKGDAVTLTDIAKLEKEWYGELGPLTDEGMTHA